MVVIGEQRKFLSAIITLKVNMNPDMTPTNELINEVLLFFQANIPGASSVKTVDEAMANKDVMAYLDNCMKLTNEKAISQAQYIRKFVIGKNDFSIAGGELTPTMKLKRKEIEKIYAKEIEQFYMEPKL